MFSKFKTAELWKQCGKEPKNGNFSQKAEDLATLLVIQGKYRPSTSNREYNRKKKMGLTLIDNL